MNKLIIAEKPSVALRIAMALSGDGRPRRSGFSGVGYYEIGSPPDAIYVVAAAGHIFTLRQKDESKKLPVFDVEWIEAYKVHKAAYFTKKYLDAISEVGKKCSFFINACDYDMEGTVIGSNIIKFLVNGNVNSEIRPGSVKRMRFSTTTNVDLIESFNNLNDFDFSNLYAGETRHMIDWMWGINMSRALMQSIASVGVKKTLSVGRVQGPTLAILSKREREIKEFKPEPYWKVFIKIGDVDFENKRGSIMSKIDADTALANTEKGPLIVKNAETKDELKPPFPPFDLTSLQVEASRVFKIDPSRTLAIAQVLYERAYISYPRTASQKLPYSLNLRRIITDLARNDKLAEPVRQLLDKQRFKPHEGPKEDEAHPAIYPTGEIPRKLNDEEERVYLLISKRFLSCFAEYAKIARTTISIESNGEGYSATGDEVLQEGWLSFYPYYKLKESKMPKVSAGDKVKADKIYLKDGMTEPPRRYTKAMLISLLERKNLGTKATRSAIIDTLLNRGYIKSVSIEVTEFGMSVYNALDKYCKEIIDEELTRKLESNIEEIARSKKSESEVIEDAKKTISMIMGAFIKNSSEIGNELKKGLKETELSSVLGTCKCGGNLVIKISKNRKQFVGCSNWPNCNVTYPLPQYSKIIPLHKICELCNTPMVKVFSRGKVFQMDLDPKCESKKDWGKKDAEHGAKLPRKPSRKSAGQKQKKQAPASESEETN
jgi:DNA topoisomerase-1